MEWAEGVPQKCVKKEVYLGVLLKTKLYMHKVKLNDSKQQTTKIVNYTIPELTRVEDIHPNQPESRMLNKNSGYLSETQESDLSSNATLDERLF